MRRISVLIVDDHPPLRAGVRSILEGCSDLHVVGEAANGSEAEKLLDELHPNIILLDLKMPDFYPALFEKWARDNHPETATLVLTAHDHDAYLASMMEAGAVGYLDKGASAEQLIAAIRRAASGENVFDGSQKKRVRKWCENVEKRWNRLSKRERQVLRSPRNMPIMMAFVEQGGFPIAGNDSTATAPRSAYSISNAFTYYWP